MVFHLPLQFSSQDTNEDGFVLVDDEQVWRQAFRGRTSCGSASPGESVLAVLPRHKASSATVTVGCTERSIGRRERRRRGRRKEEEEEKKKKKKTKKMKKKTTKEERILGFVFK